MPWINLGNSRRALRVNEKDLVIHHYLGGKEYFQYLVGDVYKTDKEIKPTDIREVVIQNSNWKTVLTLTDAEKTYLMLLGEK